MLFSDSILSENRKIKILSCICKVSKAVNSCCGI